MTWLTCNAALWIYGQLLNHLMILSEMSAARKAPVHPFAYAREKPYKAATSVICALIAYSFLKPDAAPYEFFAAGYLANDIVDRVGSIGSKTATRTIVVNEQGQAIKERLNDETIITYAENEALDRPSELRREMHGD